MATQQIKAVIFDFDGLVVDTEMPDFRSWQQEFTAHGATLTLEFWAQFIGSGDYTWSPYDQLETAVGRPIDRAAVRATRRARFDELLARETLRPGVEEYLAEARRLGLGVGLASSSDRDWIEGHLRAYGLDGAFDTIHTGDDVVRTKPDPELYRLSVAALGVDAGEAIALEDSPNGISAANAAGLYCVAVPNDLTRRLALDAADVRLDSLADMPLAELLRRIR